MMLWNSAISVNDLEAITTIARHIGLCRTSNTFNLFSDSLAPSKDQCEWISSFSEDPDLALEAVYLKLRFQLRNLGRHSGMTGNCKNTRQLLKGLKGNGPKIGQNMQKFGWKDMLLNLKSFLFERIYLFRLKAYLKSKKSF